MTAKGGSERFSLSRWSRRKLAAAVEAPVTQASASAIVPKPAPGTPTPSAALELPPVESLTFDSDFTAFLQPGVDDELKRAALKQLFRDPRFNIMDGLDTYIGDYTKADPIPPDIVADLLKRGFGSMSETGQEQVAAVNAPHEEPAVTSATRPAISDGSGHVAALTHPIHEVGEQGKHAKLSADDGKVARADDGAADAGGVQKQR